MLKKTVLILLVLSLTACGNPSLGSLIGLINNAQTQANSQPRPGAYTRPETYPNIYAAPAQYIPTTTGNDVLVHVALPANQDGTPASGRFPVILVQAGYNSTLLGFLQSVGGGALLGTADPFFIKRGYAMVSVDVVGTGASQGGWELIGATEQQAYGDVVDWVQRQPWAGNIGVSGASYMGITALLTAQQRPDAIKAVFAASALGDAVRGTVGTGGLVNGLFLSYWVPLTQFTSVQGDLVKQNAPNLSAAIDAATQQHIDQIDNYYLPLINKVIQGDPAVVFGDFGKTRSPILNMDKIKAPTFITGSLNDLFQRDAPLLYESIKNRVDSRLMIFDGTHIGGLAQAIAGTDKTDPLQNLLLQWFDKYLLGIDSKVERIPRVTQYIKNYKFPSSSSFSTATDWPNPAAAPQRWYLHGDNSLSLWQPFFVEATHTMKAAPPATYSFSKSSDGKLLAATVTPNDGSQCSLSDSQWTLGFTGLSFDSCYYDDRAVEKGALNFESGPMLTDYYINGPIQADVWISSTTTDAVVSVRIDEVTPLGQINPLSNGLLLASARAVDTSRSRYVRGTMVQPYQYFDPTNAKPLTPGQVTKMQIEVFQTSAIVRAGSRLRVSISPSNEAQGILNIPQQQRVNNGVTTIYNSPAYPSSVVVMTVPLNQLN